MTRTIVHLSDLHVGRVDPGIPDRLVASIRSVEPDVVAVSGDLTQWARRRAKKNAAMGIRRASDSRNLGSGR